MFIYYYWNISVLIVSTSVLLIQRFFFQGLPIICCFLIIVAFCPFSQLFSCVALVWLHGWHSVNELHVIQLTIHISHSVYTFLSIHLLQAWKIKWQVSLICCQDSVSLADTMLHCKLHRRYNIHRLTLGVIWQPRNSFGCETDKKICQFAIGGCRFTQL